MPATHTDKPFRYLSVCSGMEAASVAWHPLGWEPAGFSEIEPFPAAILAHRFPNTPNHGDLTQHHTWNIEPNSIDLLVGGTPCQSFSVAGLRKGLADPRGNLALTFLALADRIKPRWIVWENVPGVLSSGGGRDFGSFLGALVELGYGFAYRVLDAQYFGVPQRRRRVFVVACLGDWRAPAEVLSLREGLRGYLASGGKKRKSPAADAGAGAEAGSILWNGSDQANAERVVDKAGTLNCDQGQRGGYICPISHWDGGPHPTLNRGGQGQIGYSNQEIFSQGGCGLVPGQPIPYRKAKRAQSTTDDETWVEGQVSNTLNNFDLGDTRTTHAVVEPMSIHENQRAEITLSETAGTVKCAGGKPGQGYPAIIQSVVEPFCSDKTGTLTVGHNSCAGHQHRMGDNSFLVGQPIISPTITTCKGSRGGCSDEAIQEITAVHLAHQQTHTMPGTVAPTIIQASELRLQGKITEQKVCPTLKAGTKQGDTEPLALHPVAFQPGNLARRAGSDPSIETFPTLTKDSGDQSPHIAYPMAVRRLTPVECERLQGFPDNWSRISWKGKPETDCPDGPRYKACGNSMAVPVMRWIGEQIAKFEANSR